MSTTDCDERSAPGRFSRFAARADAYFIPEALRNAPAAKVANTRMGLLLCLTAGLGSLLYVPLQATSWPFPAYLVTALGGLLLLALPFCLRQRLAIRSLGQIVCVALALASASALATSAGRAIAILAFLPMLPVVGLLVSGRRSALFWTGVAFVIAALSLVLVSVGRPPMAGYSETNPIDRYAIAFLCILGMGALTQGFESFRGRTAMQLADRARAELLAREERNRSLLEYATEGVMVVGRDAVVQFASPAAERLLGLGPGEAIGHRLRDFTATVDFLATRSVWQKALEAPDEVGVTQLRTRPGLGHGDPADARVLDITVANRLDNPAVDGLIVRMRDSTELVRAEANYEALVEHSLQGIAVSCGGTIVYANQALADLFGVEREQLISVSDEVGLRRIHEEDRARVRSAFLSSDLELPGATEMRYCTRAGDWRWIQMRWAHASWEGRPARQIAYADITAEKELAARSAREQGRLEAAILEATQELEASQRSLREQERMAAVGTLAAGIAHQINNPIGAILASADFAILVADEQDGEKVRADALADIRTQAIRCGKIVRSVLQFARAEPTEKWSSEPTGVLRAAVDVTHRYALDRNATIEVAIAPQLDRTLVSINPIEMEQVFVNLIRNAIESRSSGVRIQLSARLVGEEVEVSIEDDGPGIPAIHAGHVFEPFYTTRLREGGTGLGLSVAHGIIEDHGGRMWLDTDRAAHLAPDETPRGARFLVRLPAEKPAVRA